MTKWGMPGVYTHAFMDGWSPGYLGSVAYNHNGMMKMYETAVGPTTSRPTRWPTASPTRDRPGVAARSAAAVLPAWRRRAAGAVAAAVGGRGGAAGAAAGRGRPRRRRRTRRRPAAPAGAAARTASGIAAFRCRRTACAAFTRRDNTNYMETGVLSALQLTSMFPKLGARELLRQDAQLDRRRQRRRRRTRYVIPVAARHDQAARRSSTSCARRASRSARSSQAIRSATTRSRPART